MRDVLLHGPTNVRPEYAVLRSVCAPLPTPVEQACRAYDRLTRRLRDIERHAPSLEVAELEFARATFKAALGEGEPDWPSPVAVLAARQDLEGHAATLQALTSAQLGADDRIGRAIVASEQQLVEILDDKLGAVQHEAHLRKAAHAVPLGLGSDGLLAAGPDTAAQAALLGDAFGRYEQIKAARHVIFDYVKPQTASCMAVVADGTEDGLIWKSENVRPPIEPEPWAGGPGGELHYAIVNKIPLRCLTAAQLDSAGYQPPGVYLQPVGMG
jgi:hypothetical protein